MQFLKKFFYGPELNGIKRFNYPECRKCKYFKPAKDQFKNETEQIKYGRCTYFGEKDLVSGELEFKYASTCRRYAGDCGEYAKYYSPKDTTTPKDI